MSLICILLCYLLLVQLIPYGHILFLPFASTISTPCGSYYLFSVHILISLLSANVIVVKCFLLSNLKILPLFLKSHLQCWYLALKFGIPDETPVMNNYGLKLGIPSFLFL